jgi:hypothetical protein
MSDFTFPLSWMVQVIIFASLTLIVLLPLYLAYLWAVQRRHKESSSRTLPVITAFMLGFFLGGALGWILLPPPQWKLSFLNTLRASYDPAHSFGHQTGHGAEFLLQWIAIFALTAGLLSATAAVLGIRRAAPAWHEPD